MLLHATTLVECEAPWLLKQAGWKTYLSDVMDESA
jgi:hypothetical protein